LAVGFELGLPALRVHGVKKRMKAIRRGFKALPLVTLGSWLTLNSLQACPCDGAEGMSADEKIARYLKESDRPKKDYIYLMEECEKLQASYPTRDSEEKQFALKFIKLYLKHLKASVRNKEWISTYKDRVSAIEQWVADQ